MEPEKFVTELAESASQKFISLLKSFILWYGLFLYTFFTSFETYQYAPLLIVVLIPLLINMMFFYRSKIVEILRSMFWRV
jgi:hypothetical protein